MKIPISILLLLSIFWIGCPSSEMVFLEPEIHDPKLVLNGVFTDSEPVEVYVSRSFGMYLDSGEVYISGAMVNLYEDGEQIALLTEQSSVEWVDIGRDSLRYKKIFYTAAIIPQAGKTYRVEVSHEDFDPIWAETQLPQKGHFSSARLGLNTVDQGGAQFGSIVMRVEVEDIAYVGIEGEIETFDSTLASPTVRIPMSFVTQLNDPKIPVDNKLLWIAQGVEENQIFFRSEDLFFQINELERVFVSYVFYDSIFHTYLVELEDHFQSTLGENNNIFPKEGTELPSNVQGGYGILGSFVSIKDTL